MGDCRRLFDRVGTEIVAATASEGNSSNAEFAIIGELVADDVSNDGEGRGCGVGGGKGNGVGSDERAAFWRDEDGSAFAATL